MSSKRTRPEDPIVHSRLAHFACKRCRSRKVKCDEESPRCSGCSKAEAPCIVADYSTTRDYTRAEVHVLEEKLLRLEALLAPTSNSPDDAPAQELVDQPQHGSEARRFVGPESGINFIQPIVDAIRMQPQIRLRRQDPSTEFCAPHPLPPRTFALRAVAEYFRDFHVCHPILDQAKVETVLQRAYENDNINNDSDTALSKILPHDLFQLNMVLAIGSIRLFRDNNTLLHPFGYFTAALEANPPSESSFSHINDVENLLLIAFFGLFYNIGCSIWELGRLSVRICIESQFHRRQQSAIVGSHVGVQRRRRVFWQSYLLDRFSSSVLGRPFAIDEDVIDIDIPSEPPSSIFNLLLRIGRITSDMHVSIYHSGFRARDAPGEAAASASFEMDKPSESRKILSHLRNFHTQLRNWRQTAPVYKEPTCVYETAEFIEMTFQEARLWLFRAAINKLVIGSSSVRDRLSLLCFQAAQRIIECFDTIRGNNLISCNRSTVRLILISGLVIVTTANKQVIQSSRHDEEQNFSDVDINFWLDDLGVDSSTHVLDLATCRITLETCGQILSWFAIQMPEVLAYVQLFEILRSEVEGLDQGVTNASMDPGPAAAGEMVDDGRPLPDGTATVPILETHRNQQQQNLEGSMQQTDLLDGSDFGLYEHLGVPGTTNYLLSDTLQGDIPAVNESDLLGNDVFGSFPNVPWMEGIDGNISSFIWDMAMPWQGSPSANT